MGWTIIGGLMVSTFLTLIVVPVLYRILSGKE
jgi:multidrug efflux pump subunit AcrB